jgi:hypothetical protein
VSIKQYGITTISLKFFSPTSLYKPDLLQTRSPFHSNSLKSKLPYSLCSHGSGGGATRRRLALRTTVSDRAPFFVHHLQIVFLPFFPCFSFTVFPAPISFMFFFVLLFVFFFSSWVLAVRRFCLWFRRRHCFFFSDASFVFLVVVVVAPVVLFFGGFGAAMVRFNGGGRCSDDVIGVIRCSGDGPVVLELRWGLWVEVMRCVVVVR